MRLMGLTGGVASGKSTVARMLADRGAVIIDSDELAREVVRPGEPAHAAILERFGREIAGPDGELDRARLGAIVFADEGARRDLERITHPRIAELSQQRLAEAIAHDAPVTVIDVPLLYEAHREEMFEGVLLVYAPEPVLLSRAIERDGLDAGAARQRMRAQLPIEEKRARATWVIDNSGSLEDTRHQVDDWWAEEIGL
jgi:dephospho-CoA kinase